MLPLNAIEYGRNGNSNCVDSWRTSTGNKALDPLSLEMGILIPIAQCRPTGRTGKGYQEFSE